MKKLYRAESLVTAVFVADAHYVEGVLDERSLNSTARMHIDDELNNNGHTSMKVSEVKGLDDLPEGWSKDCFVWGADEEITVARWFSDMFENEERIGELEEQIAALKEELESLKVAQNQD